MENKNPYTWDKIKNEIGEIYLPWYKEVEGWGLETDVTDQFNKFYPFHTDNLIQALDWAMQEWDL